jgi:hypothetical protein
MDVENLDAGQEFNELPDTYTIFITEKDFFGKAEPFYLFRWTEVQSKEFLNDGAYILYVNGEYRGDDELGRLMHDFNCTNATDMNYNIMAERTRYLKENQEGVTEMCKAMEEMRNETAIKARNAEKKESALRMKAMGLSDEVIAKAVDVSLTIIKQWIGITTA